MTVILPHKIDVGFFAYGLGSIQDLNLLCFLIEMN